MYNRHELLVNADTKKQKLDLHNKMIRTERMLQVSIDLFVTFDKIFNSF